HLCSDGQFTVPLQFCPAGDFAPHALILRGDHAAREAVRRRGREEYRGVGGIAVTLVAVKQGRESSRVNRVIPRTGTEKCVYLLLTIKMNVINISLSIGKIHIQRGH
ncbi:hypothetical protein ACJUUH_005523, partial [Serratia marcescens]